MGNPRVNTHKPSKEVNTRYLYGVSEKKSEEHEEDDDILGQQMRKTGNLELINLTKNNPNSA